MYTEAQKKWYQNNKHKFKEYERRYRLKNPEKMKLKSKKYKQANPDKCRFWNKDWRTKNREKNLELKRASYYRNRHTSTFGRIRTRCKKMNIEFSLTPEWIKQRFDNGICELTGISFDMVGKMTPNSPSIDRINPNGGYTPENCRMIIWSLNRALCDYGQEYMFMLFEKVLRKVKPEVFK